MNRLTTVAMLAAALLVPTAAQAKPPKAKPAKPVKAQKCKQVQTVGFVVEGTLARVDAANIQVTVVGANAHARGYLRTRPATFETAGARLSFDGVADADGNGMIGLADAAVGDAVKVVAKLTQPKKGCTADTRLRLSAVEIARAADPVIEEPPVTEPTG